MAAASLTQMPVRGWHTGCNGSFVDSSQTWLEKGARFGHFTKGVLYGLIGALALQAALGQGGQVAGGEEAARFVGHQPFGRVLLALIAVGLSGYSIWRFIEGVQDTEHKGSDAMGLLGRAAAVLSGLLNGALSVAVFQMALGRAHSGGGARSWVGQLLELPLGTPLVGIAGVGIVVAGLYQFYRAYTKDFLDAFRFHSMSPDEQRWITRMGQIGYGARGVVFPIVGIGFLRAALEQNPSRTRDVREALLEIARSDAGQVALGLVAVGFLAFGLFMIASARYRRMLEA
jgi:hypothetical protein